VSNIFLIFWLGVLPLVMWPGAVDFEFPKFIVILIAVNLWAIPALINVKGNLFKVNNQIDKLIILTGIVATLSWLVNGSTGQGLIGLIYRYQGLITTWTLIEFYFVSKKIIKWQESKRFIIWIVRVILTIYFLGYRDIMGNPNFLGAYIAVISAFLVDRNFCEIEGKAESVWIIWMTGSRSAMMAWLINIILRGRKMWLIVSLIIVAGAIVYFPKKAVSSFDNRLILWNKTLLMIQEKPLLGWGPENFEIGFNSVLNDKDFDLKNVRVDRSHNLFLDIATNTGIVGLVVWGWFLVILFKNSGEFFYPLLSFLVIANLNVISLNSWVLFYLTTAMVSEKFLLRKDF